ncbi:MAG: hypothetical protein FWE83_07375, partial [Oscillospiraceae bacterium]|nr:hypothetical protein [Oscillospiraceae bacterium]
MKTVIIILSAVCIAVLLLTSCGKTQGVDDDSSADPDVSFEVKTDYIESYIYQAVRLSLPVTGDQLQAAHTHEGRIYLCFIDGEHDERQKAVFMSIAADGSDVQRTEIELNPNSVLLDFSVTVEGNIAVFILENNDDEKVVFYSEYNRDGYQELRRDFSEFFRVNLVQRDIDQAIISNRSIVVSVWNPGESELYLLCLDSEQHTSFELNDSLHRFGGIVRLPNENVAVLDTVEGKHTLREINFAEKAWGRDYPVAPRNYDSLFPASESSSFDILMSDGIYLYGYCTETRVQMTLLEWVEAGISGVFHVGEGHLGIMAKRLKRQGFKRFTLLADKGYYNGSDLLKMKRFKV